MREIASGLNREFDLAKNDDIELSADQSHGDFPMICIEVFVKNAEKARMVIRRVKHILELEDIDYDITGSQVSTHINYDSQELDA